MTYAPVDTLNAISDNAVAVVLIGGLSIVAMLVFFIEGAATNCHLAAASVTTPPYVGICVASCVWSVIVLVDAHRAGVRFASWRPQARGWPTVALSPWRAGRRQPFG